MSKQAFKRLRRALGMKVSREELPNHEEGYPIFYGFTDGGECCAKCVNHNIVGIDADRTNSHGGWTISYYEANWEDNDMVCDHCGKEIPSAYGKD